MIFLLLVRAHRKAHGARIAPWAWVSIIRHVVGQRDFPIQFAYYSVNIGDRLVKFVEPANIPMQMRTDTAEPVKVASNAAVVVYSRDSRYLSAGGDMLIIDKGAGDGLKIGDVLLVTRTRSFPVGSADAKHAPSENTTYYIGQALVVRIDAQSATCRVLRASEELRQGDVLTP